MTTAAWWNCPAGIAGDMALASLLDAGADQAMVLEGLRSLPLDGWHLEPVRTLRAGLAATALVVRVEPSEGDAHRSAKEVRRIVESATALPSRVVERSLSVFDALARAEGRLHGLPAGEVHFHEVGSVDAILDVVGTCLALESFGVERIFAGPVALGTGTVRSRHGLLPNPAPAVLELLAGAPTYGTEHQVELTTPTGAAILAALASGFGPMPAMTPRATGYGAGTRELPGMPNATQVVIGELAGDQANATVERLVLIEANVDDVTGEILAYTLEMLLSAGALDAWLVPVLGKKGRPAHVVSALCRAADAEALCRVVFEQTGTLGARRRPVERLALERSWVEVEVEGKPVRVKVGPHRAKAEYDDCVAVSAATGMALRDVAAAAERAAGSPAL
ncbi:MAG TPA: nickel pincer cofactor biosynthesis protein LarC [Acidimicrobiales bacterium]|nr:nickel pincer cofactor biosynthesis protein LarC [Acidimicrobiales bacterium]